MATGMFVYPISEAEKNEAPEGFRKAESNQVSVRKGTPVYFNGKLHVTQQQAPSYLLVEDPAGDLIRIRKKDMYLDPNAVPAATKKTTRTKKEKTSKEPKTTKKIARVIPKDIHALYKERYEEWTNGGRAINGLCTGVETLNRRDVRILEADPKMTGWVLLTVEGLSQRYHFYNFNTKKLLPFDYKEDRDTKEKRVIYPSESGKDKEDV